MLTQTLIEEESILEEDIFQVSKKKNNQFSTSHSVVTVIIEWMSHHICNLKAFFFLLRGTYLFVLPRDPHLVDSKPNLYQFLRFYE